jgi:hypothetical protein
MEETVRHNLAMEGTEKAKTPPCPTKNERDEKWLDLEQ